MLKSISIVLALTLLGCGGSGSSSMSKKSATLEDAKLLAKGAVSVKNLGDSFKQQGQSYSSNDSKKTRLVTDMSEECSNGSMSIDISDSYLNAIKNQQAPTSMKVTLIADNCLDSDGDTTDGKMSFDMSLDENGDMSDSINVSFPTDYSINSSENSMKFFAGGSMKIEDGEPYGTMSIDLKMSEDGKTYEGKNLVYKIKDDGNRVETFPISGEESFGNGVLFIVDTNYDASQTPMVEIGDKLQVGGLFKYHDGVGHKVEVKATNIDEVTVWVDENGDGARSDNEIGVVRD